MPRMLLGNLRLCASWLGQHNEDSKEQNTACLQPNLAGSGEDAASDLADSRSVCLLCVVKGLIGLCASATV